MNGTHRMAAAGLVLFHALAAAPASTAAVDAIDPDRLAGMQARSIGPAGMSGRIAAIDAVESNPDIIYVGAATGGVWKSVNRGLTWEPIFDDQPVQAIGAVSIYQANPDIVWVGTGEGNTRNSISVGNGVYRSIDGGATWTHLGLAETERIHRIILHPDEPDTAWVAAPGKTWGENAERGVFKTIDGGATWQKVLYIDEQTGAGDLAIDPANPDHLIATMWQHRRWPWLFRSGGPSSGLFVSRDGGDSWSRQGTEEGLPAGELGRIGVAFCRNHPETVYALVEAERSALLRSGDGGRTWRTVNTAHDIASRPFYYADLRVDPERPDRVYNLWSLLSASDDGGQSFEILAPYAKVHPDHHALWIDPNDPDFLIDGNDGGVAMSEDRGRTWRFVRNLPLAQYYHIQVDRESPYNVYGGMQDNGSWRGPSAVRENGGIRNGHWREVGFGDGFDTRIDPTDPERGYSMSQRGFLKRFDLRTGERKDIRPPEPDGVELRFNWNAALAIDPFDPATIYYGSQFVHRSTDRGNNWTLLSADLTTDNADWQHQADSGGLTPDVTGAENFTSILSIVPSPVEAGVIWVGTDDGRLHVTRDGGDSWTSVESNLRGVPADTWIPHIEPSPHDAGTAFVVLDNHRRSDWTPYVFRTDNFGRRWRSIATGNLRGYALSIVQDPVNPELLFLGTEFGLWVSLDGGRDWLPWRHGIPAVGVRDLVIHPVEHDLVVGTHGRSAFIIDDLTPLREIDAAVLARPLHLFPIGAARQYRIYQTGHSPRFAGWDEFRGDNRPYGALITWSLNQEELPSWKEWNDREEKKKKAKAARKIQVPLTETEPEEPEDDGTIVEIRMEDSGGAVIRTLKVPAHAGVNRTTWDLRREPFAEPPGGRAWWRGEAKGPEIPPGDYRITIAFGGHEATGTVRVLPDPRTPVAATDTRIRYETILRAGAEREKVAAAIDSIRTTIEDIDIASVRAKKRKTGDSDDGESELLDEFLAAADTWRNELTALEKRFWAPPDTVGYVKRDDALAKINYVLGSVTSSWEAPSAAQFAYLEQAERLIGERLREWEVLAGSGVTELRDWADRLGIALFDTR